MIMAYEYFKLQSEDTLHKILERGPYEHYTKNIQDISLEELYDMSGNKIEVFIDCVINPLLHIYGIALEIDGISKRTGGIIEEKYYDIKITDYYESVSEEAFIKIEIIKNIEMNHTDIYVRDATIYVDDIKLLLNPVSFFEYQEFGSPYKLVLKIVQSNIDYCAQIDLLVRCICDIYLVCDLSMALREMVFKLLCSS